MCAICGIFSLGGQPLDASVLEGVKARLVHRGPDEEGSYVAGPVGLGSRRLAILDLPHGRQPVSTEDKMVWVVHNGEIYNFVELRRELEGKGYRFRTGTDTEVVAAGYHAFGTKLFPRLSGMFAVAIWDARTQHLLLARDRVGIKPLYYTVTDDYLAFASEPRSLMAFPFVKAAVNYGAILPYLCLEYVPTPDTMYAGIRRLEPGHFIRAERGGVEQGRYWDLELGQSEQEPRRTEAAYIAEIRRTVEQSVEAELVSDVPVGVFLSGGVDSSAVAACAARVAGSQLKSFSIGFTEGSFNELPYARAAAKTIGTRHHELTISAADALQVVERIPSLIDEPLADSSFVPTYLVSRLARQHVKVVLSGDGGDELFGGYSTLQAHQAARWLAFIPKSAWRLMLHSVSCLPTSMDNLSLDFKLKRFVKGMAHPSAVRHHVWLGAADADQARSLLASDLARQLELVEPYEAVLRHASACGTEQLLNQILYLDTKLYLEGDILPKVDRASMACSLEARVPLLNSALLDLAAQLPIDMKIRGFSRRYAFRRAIRGLVPDEILRRPKKGFNIPVAHWIRGPMKNFVGDILSESRLRHHGLFDPGRVRLLLDQHWAGRHDHRKVIWTLLMFQLWYDHHISAPVAH